MGSGILPAIRCHCGLNVAPSADMIANILLPLLALLPFPYVRGMKAMISRRLAASEVLMHTLEANALCNSLRAMSHTCIRIRLVVWVRVRFGYCLGFLG